MVVLQLVGIVQEKELYRRKDQEAEDRNDDMGRAGISQTKSLAVSNEYRPANLSHICNTFGTL